MKRDFLSKLLLFIALISLGACSEKLNVVKPTKTEALSPELLTVVVFDFEDNSIGQHPALAGLGRSLANRISMGLTNQPGLALIDRNTLEEVLRELSFSSGDLVSEQERLRLGKLLGAQYLILGTYLAIETGIRIDARIVEVERALVDQGSFIKGLVSERTALEVAFSKKMSNAFLAKTAGRLKGQGSLPSSNDFLQKGLAFERTRQFSRAMEYYQKAVFLDPENQGARDRMEDLLLKELE